MGVDATRVSVCMCVFPAPTEPQEAIICHFKVLTHNPRSVDSFALETLQTEKRREGRRGRAREREERANRNEMRKTLTMCNINCALECLEEKADGTHFLDCLFYLPPAFCFHSFTTHLLMQ